MQTQNKDTANLQTGQPVEPRHRLAWLASLGAFIIVMLVIGASITIFALVGQRQGSQHNPAAGQWKQVQTGYLFTSMQSAPSNPAVLYACATTSAVASNRGNTGQATILRSADFGDHWQNVGAHFLQGNICELTLSPTDSNEIYVVTENNTPQSIAVLEHSTDGGQTWSTISPALSAPDIKTVVPWFAQQVRFDGHNLYGVQWIITSTKAIPKQPQPPVLNRLSRLVTSVDGGHTWTIIDGQFTGKGLGAQAYVLDPAHAGTIYEIAGKPWFPFEQTTPEPNNILPAFDVNQQLFKTTDNGASWQPLLTGLPFGSQLQLASDNPQIVYVGGIRGPLPLVAHPGGTTIPPSDKFQLQVSMDGGASWHQVATPPDEQTIQSWYVGADGHLYTSPSTAFSTPGAQGTAVAGTAVVGTVGPVTPVNGASFSVGKPNSAMTDFHASYQVYIQSYDPSNRSWRQVTTPPAAGGLIQVTAADAHGGAVLWFMGVGGSQYALYRYLV